MTEPITFHPIMETALRVIGYAAYITAVFKVGSVLFPDGRGDADD